MDEEYEKIIKKIDDFNEHNLVQRLSDLSEEILNEVALDVASDDLTELEKALVCVALYWFNQDVTEEKGYCSNASKNKKVDTLSRGEYDYEGGRGGEIGAFWWSCSPYKIAGSTSNNLDMFTRQFFSQDSSTSGKSAPPQVGNIFYRQQDDGSHCGIVVKVDAENKKFWTILRRIQKYLLIILKKL